MGAGGFVTLPKHRIRMWTFFVKWINMSKYLSVLVFFISLIRSGAFYLPGLAPVTYCARTNSPNCQTDVPVYVNRLTTLSTLIPYEYDRFDLCQNEKDEYQTLNLGQALFGERIKLSPYKLEFMRDVSCETVCEKTYYPGDKEHLQKLLFMEKSIELNYQQNWIIDNMPVTWCYQVEDNYIYCSRSFPLGCYVTRQGKQMNACVMSAKFSEEYTYYFFNHVELTITYQRAHSQDSGESRTEFGRILSAKVQPKSIAYDPHVKRCNYYKAMGIKGGKLTNETTIRYSYSVRWEEDRNYKWSSRWDYILSPPNGNKIMWFSVINSFVVIVFLTAIVLRIAIVSLSRSAESRTNSCCCKKAADKFTWKLIYGDVFRPPGCGMLFAVFNGSGVQVFLTATVTLIFASLGFLSPANRGALETCIVVSFVCLGFPAGLVSARLYKAFGGKKKLLNALLTATACPGIVFLFAMILNLMFWAEGSSAAIPFTTILALLGLWLGVSLPLTFIGAFFEFRRKTSHSQFKTDPVPRHIPSLRFYLKPLMGMIVGGILPFGCIFISEFFILNSIWAGQIFYSYGIMILIFILMAICCALVTVMLCYFHLCAEDYRWWWRSFLSSSFTSVYFFIYCIHYYVNKMEIQGVTSIFIFFGYMLIVTFLIFLMTGTIGFFSCFLFVRKIYGNVKNSEMWSAQG